MSWAWLYPLALCASVMSFSVLMPRVAVQLSVAGHSGVEIGLFSMITFLVVFLSTPFMPWLYRRFGINGAFMLGLGANAVSVLGLTHVTQMVWLCLSAVVAGFAACCLWGASETLIARAAPPEKLGSVTGLYQTLLGSVLALGPFLPGLFGLDDAQVRLLVLWSLLLAVVLVGLAWLRGVTVDLGEPAVKDRASWGRVLQSMPVLLVAAFAGGVFEAGISNVGSAQTAQRGVELGHAVYFAGVVAVGSLAMQWPVGMLADRVVPERLLAFSLWLLLATSVLASAVPSSLNVWWACALCWGGIGGALYTLAMISVGKQFRGGSTARFTGAAIAAYTAGCIVGPLLNGMAFDLNPARGMPLLLALMACLALIAAKLLSRSLHQPV